jgi:hypothetical protein
MIKFSKEKVLLLHQLIAQETGGSVGVRDEGLLESALETAFSSFGGQEFYPTKEEKGARIGYRIPLSISQRLAITSLTSAIPYSTLHVLFPLIFLQKKPHAIISVAYGLFYRRRINCSVRNTATQLAAATTIRLLFFIASNTATIKPTTPLTICSVAYSRAGKVMAVRQATGT